MAGKRRRKYASQRIVKVHKDKPIANETQWKDEPGLPFPSVLYPSYGWWIAFAEDQDCQPRFCSCMLPSIRSWLAANIENGGHRLIPGDTNLLHHFISPQRNPEGFHIEVLEELESSNIFRPNICHVCAGHVPSLRQHADAYGHTILEQHFGWFLEAISWELGLPPAFDSRKNRYTIAEEARVALLDRLGTPEGLTSETLLYLCVRGAFPSERIERRRRHHALNGKELDLWLPDRRLGIEYQGDQHFRPIAAFGGKEGHEATVRRDKEKRDRCKELGIYIEEFTKDDPLTEQWIKERILRYWYDPDKSLPEGKIPTVSNVPSGPDWELLSGDQQFGVLLQIWILEEMAWRIERWGQSFSQAAEEVSDAASRRWGTSGTRKHGLAKVSILNKYSRWKKRGDLSRWQDCIRYNGIQKDKGAALRDQGLTPELARAFFRQVAGGIKDWSKSHGFTPYLVSNCLDRNRTGSKDREIARALRRSIDALKAELSESIASSKSILSREQARLKKLESSLAKLGHPLS